MGKLIAGIAAGIAAAVTGLWLWVVRQEQKKTDPTAYNKEQD